MGSNSAWASALENSMALEDFNICEDHGLLPPEEIMVGGESGGIPFCTHENCGKALFTQQQLDSRIVNQAIEEAYANPGE